MSSPLSVLYKMVRMSWQKATVIFVILLLVMWVFFVVFTDKKFHHQIWYKRPAPCKTPDSIIEDMKTIIFKIHESLDKLGIPHAVCYGTLWGTLRNGEILPWDNNVDFCVNSLHMAKVSRALIIDTFEKNEMKVLYDSRHGFYELTYKSGVAYITMFLQSLHGDMYRTGWEYNLLWWFQEKPVSFPARLLDTPFSTAKLYGQDIPVPHEDIEILKYLYPDDWWLEVKPPGCK